METKNHIVVPIFYRVEPDDVKYVRGSFQKAFAEHEYKSTGTMEERERWRSALTRVGNIDGWNLRQYEDDFKLINKIVTDIWTKIRGSKSTSRSWKYDVFLSFRGLDTRKSFVCHFPGVLGQKALTSFIDTEGLRKGQDLRALLKAIDDSKLSIVGFSENYASSTWCLKELVQILECMDTKNQIVVPIFYKVDPAHVRYQKGSFEKAFAKHEHDGRETKEELQSWRAALRRAATISGWDSCNSQNDAQLIQSIVDDIFKKLIETRSSESESRDLVGMNYHIRQMEILLGSGSNDVRIVGIWGMGGIGKTTIARAVYEKLCGKFDHHCFLYNVKEDFKRKGEAGMQEELLYRISGNNVQHVSSQMIMERLSGIKNLFLVIDDVDNTDQIDALLGKPCSFGGGSKIIITTRDRGLLREFEVYEPDYLDDNLALELFKKYAFRTIRPSTEYDHLSQHAIKYAQGLPLALKVLGASLYKKSVREWEVEFEKIKKCQHLGIEGVLRTTFEGLDHLQKTVLLDIACFFRGMKKDYATEILEACGFFPISVLPVLADRALVTSTGYYVVLAMHDLLLDMALGIVRRESSFSRLSSSDEIEEVLTQNTDTKAVESIDLDLYHQKTYA